MQVRHLGRGRVDEESNKNIQKGESIVKKVISLTQILVCAFFYNSNLSFLLSIMLQSTTKRGHPRKSLTVYNLK